MKLKVAVDFILVRERPTHEKRALGGGILGSMRNEFAFVTLQKLFIHCGPKPPEFVRVAPPASKCHPNRAF